LLAMSQLSHSEFPFFQRCLLFLFFFNDTATTEIYTLSLHDALPILVTVCPSQFATRRTLFHVLVGCGLLMLKVSRLKLQQATTKDRKSGSAGMPRPISYAVFCLKKKKNRQTNQSA